LASHFFVPSYLVLQGKLYAKVDKRRESAFTLSYIISNVGFLVAALSGGYLVKYFGYANCFRISTIVTLVTYLIYFFGWKTIKAYPGRSIEPQLKWSPLLSWTALIVSAALLVIAATWLIEHARESNLMLFGLIAIITVALFFVATKRKSKVERRKLFAFIILSYISVGFWALYTLEPSLLTIFIKNNVDRSLFGALIPPSTFYGLDPFFIITLGFAFSFLWIYLHRTNRNPMLPTKFTISLFAMGAGFMVLVVGIYFAASDGLINMYWIIAAYFLLSLAELLISPIGQAMVGRLAPEGMEGRLMGVWQLFMGFSGALSGYLAQFAIVPKHMSAFKSNPIYATAFTKIGLMTLSVALISLALIPYVKKLLNSNQPAAN